MRVAWWPAAIVVAAAQYVCADRALADRLEDAPKEPTVLLFSGVDLWREGGFLHGGILWSPQGLSDEGLALKLVFGAGAYRYRSGALDDAEVMGRVFSASLMPGWRFKRGGLIVTLFAGLDAQEHDLSPADPSSSLEGSLVGVRSGFDLWYEPTAAMMVSADASYSTIGGGYGGRLAMGWRILNRIYLGPEAAVFNCDDYRQYRVGLHFTGFRTERFELSAGLGYVEDSDDRDGAYVRLGLLARR